MPAADYLGAAVGLAAALGVVAWGAARLSRRLLPDWSGARFRLAEVVVGLAAVMTTAQVLGAVGAFRRGPVMAAVVAVGLGMAALGRGAERVPSPDRIRRQVSWSPPAIVAGVALGVVAVQWAAKVAAALTGGMTHVDTLWYHAPYAARFVQDGRLTRLLDRPDALHAYVTHDAELVQALLTLPFGRDIVAPLVNVGWAALALLAAWCVGRRRGVSTLCVLGAVVVLGLPTIAGTHPGQASNDVAAAALLLASVALLIEGGLAPAPAGLAGLAAGLAVGTKLTVAAPVVLLAAGVVVLALRQRRPGVVAAFSVALTATAAFWFLRNWAVAGTPLPWFDVHLGPVRWTAAVPDRSESVADYLMDTRVWRDRFLPGLPRGLGPTWFLVLGLALAGAVVSVVRAREPLARLAGGMVLLGALAYVFTPLTADGEGLSFVYNLRYLTPVLLLGLVLLPLLAAGGRGWWRTSLVWFLVAMVAANALAAHHERVPAWPGRYVVAGVAACIVAVLVGVAAAVLRGRPTRTPAVVGAAVLVAAGIGGGWLLQRHYLAHRYVDSELPLADVYAGLADLRGQRLGVAGSLDLYPLFGSDLSNRASRVLEPRAGSPGERCRTWRNSVSEEGYDYVILSQEAFVVSPVPESWLARDPAATVVLRSGGTVVYRINGSLDPGRCLATP